MKHYGLVGKPLGHSMSGIWFSQFFEEHHIDADYQLLELLPHQLRDIHLDGYNVTYPYKETILSLLDEVDEAVQTIGAVNVVKCCLKQGRIISKGYNTDWIGFQQAIMPYLNKNEDYKALVLGTGGAAKAIGYALSKMGIPYSFVSRSAEKGILYSQLTKEDIRARRIIIHATPLGMSPLEGEAPTLPYDGLTSQHVLFDCIYQPPITPFLEQGKHYGASIVNGKQMLIHQAQAAWNIWKQ